MVFVWKDSFSMSSTSSMALPPPPGSAVTLRPYQEECIKRVIAAYEQNRYGHELLVLPTAAGKTVIFSQIIHQLAERYGLNALIVAHTDELLNQAAEKYRQVKPSAVIGKVGGGIHNYGGEVTVASVDTISRPNHLATLKRTGYGLVVVDESHRSAAPKYQRVLEALPDAFVLKVTATPDRLDGKPISDKPALYRTDILAMIEQGYLCDVKAIAIRTETSLDSVHTEAGDYREQELEAVIDTPERNRRVVEAYHDHALGRRALALPSPFSTHATWPTPSRWQAFPLPPSRGKRPSLSAGGSTKPCAPGESRCCPTCKSSLRATTSRWLIVSSWRGRRKVVLSTYRRLDVAYAWLR